MTTSGHIPAPAVSTAMPIAGMPPGAGMLTPSVIPLSTIQQFWVSNYRLTEGDMSRFMLAPTAFAQVPPQFRPGKTIDVVGLKLSSGEIQKIWRPDQIPENISQIVGGDEGEYVFWLHPLAFSASTLPSELEGLLIFRRMQRVNEQTSKKLSKLMRENPKITGKAVVSSSVRSVLLFEIDGKRVDAPQELKLHLPVFINQSSRAFEAGEIGYAWDIHGKYPETSAQTLFASSMAGIVQLDAIFDEMGTRPSTTAEYSLGYLLRDSGCRVEDGRVHFQIPYFSLFGDLSDNDDSLLVRMFKNFKSRNQNLTPHDFVIDTFIAPLLEINFGMMNQGLCVGGGFHYQNPILRASMPIGKISQDDPLGWADSEDCKIEGVATKELTGGFLKHSDRRSFEYIEVMMTNLWSLFINDMNWSSSFPGFDREAFRRKMLVLMERYRPSETPPPGVHHKAWDAYRLHMANLINGLRNPSVALTNEVYPQAMRNVPLGKSLGFARGSLLFASALPGMKFDTPEQFTLMYDKIAFLTLAYPDADVHELIEHENELHERARRRAAEDGVDQSDTTSFLGYALAEAYSLTEIERMQDATLHHRGLRGLSEVDREWLVDFIFGQEEGVFSKQLVAYFGLTPKRKRKVDYEHLPRVGYWFAPIALAMIRAEQTEGATQGIGAILAASKSFQHTIWDLKTYDRPPIRERLGRFFRSIRLWG